MPYAEGRTFYDADSHIMELPTWFREFADPGDLDRVPEVDLRAGGRMIEALERLGGRTTHDPATVAQLEKDVIGGPKGYGALGAFDAGERSRALDLLGFERQLVFPTFSAATIFFDPDLEIRYACARASNRAMTAFCEDDARLMGVGCVPLADVERAAREIDQCLAAGLAGLWIPAEPAAGGSPGHAALDPLWARLQDAAVPFLLHVGGSSLHVRPEYMNNGRPVPEDWLGGGENIRAKDFTVLHQEPEQFLAALVMDGVLERFPSLRGAVVELGASWVPGMLRRLDHAVDLWSRSEPELREFSRRPSEQIRGQLGFTPYPFEDVGQLIDEAGDDLFLFSSDYPHIEGGRNPLGRFERSLDGRSETTKARFYAENFARLFAL